MQNIFKMLLYQSLTYTLAECQYKYEFVVLSTSESKKYIKIQVFYLKTAIFLCYSICFGKIILASLIDNTFFVVIKILNKLFKNLNFSNFLKEIVFLLLFVIRYCVIITIFLLKKLRIFYYD